MHGTRPFAAHKKRGAKKIKPYHFIANGRREVLNLSVLHIEHHSALIGIPFTMLKVSYPCWLARSPFQSRKIND